MSNQISKSSINHVVNKNVTVQDYISTPSNLNLYKSNRVPKKLIQKYDMIEEDRLMILDSEMDDQIEQKESLSTEDKVCCTPELKSI